MGCFSWAGVAIVALVALRVCSKAGGGDPQTDAGPASIATAATEKLPPLAAAKLLAAYQANEIKADLEYKGKRFAVTGTVASIGSDFAGDPQVWLVTDLGVAASGLTKKFAASLKKGELIEVDCTVSGEVAGLPMLDCQ